MEATDLEKLMECITTPEEFPKENTKQGTFWNDRHNRHRS